MKPGTPFNPYRMFTGVFVPDAIVRCSDLLPGAKLAYGRLIRYAGEDGRCHPSLAAIAHELGVSRDQAKRYVRELTAAGLIRLKPRVAKAGDADTYDFVFLWHVLFENAKGVDAPMPLPGRGADAPTVGAPMHRAVGAPMHPKESQKKRVIEESQKNSCSSTGDERISRKPDADGLTPEQAAWFDEAWAGYWRKVGKKAARRAYGKAVKAEAQRQTVKAAIQKQRPAMLAREEQHRPHFATWLNGERWNDEDEPATATAGFEYERLN